MESKFDRNRSSKLTNLRTACLVFSLSAGMLATMPVMAQQVLPNVANLSADQRTELSKLLKAELQKTIASQKRLPGQVVSPVDVRFDSKTGMVLIELGKGFVPKGDSHISGELEDQLHQITGVATEILTGNLSFTGTSCTFGGISTDKLFPQEKWEPSNKKQTISPSAEAKAPVVVSAGHGRTKAKGGGWGWQRELINGWHEDIDNPTLASKLATHLQTRSKEVVAFPRSTSETIESATKLAWWKLAAKYHLARILPNEKDMWGSLPADEIGSDIRSRPRYARYLKAKAIVSLHTDAGSTTGTGSKILYATGSASSKLLADAVSCSMKEVINATPGYEQWLVRAAEASAEYGENTHAVEVPAVLVEVGFHSNPVNATVLLDPVFQDAAMRGIEKGYRVNRDGKTCVAQKLTVPNTSAVVNGPKITIATNFVGNPQFPLAYERKFTTCPSGWTCP
ncbi:N-acetylmuramoyl-L-alanine amidase [Xanthomonas fragariae]|uniref:N-acetylmuramoyl-L-alanine amidase n=1 Tax=Xanthomonas fragariae TaxID=48664 RepID=UPI001ABEBE39|nr:N-acetylmuramoyl-L-alanine amidase [Xanthomonas fragariae]UKR52007.1 N-acetylmuramoyl-L-alanine amidase [Xanthomonas fragariae]